MTKHLAVLQVKLPDEALFKRSKASLSSAKAFEIRTPEDAEDAGAILREVKGLGKELEEKRTSITKPINQALREINALFRPAQEWLSQAEVGLKTKMLAYSSEQDRIARELQAEADALARKEREKLEKRAAKAAAKGKTEKAEALSKVAEATTAPVIESAAPKVAGVVRRETWRAEVTDSLALLQYIVTADHHDLLPLIRFDQAELNMLARRFKDDLDLPGVEVIKEASIAARAR